jgi:hypothetical protein
MLVLGLSLEEVSDAQAVIRCFHRRSGCLGSIGTSAANGVLSVDGGSEGKVRGGKGKGNGEENGTEVSAGDAINRVYGEQ